MISSQGRKPALSQVGWTFGRGYLPFPKNREILWKIATDIIDHRKGGVMVLGHHNADIDAVATALIMKWTFPWINIGAFQSISQPGRKLLDHFDIEMEVDPNLSDTSLLIMIDSSSPLQVITGGPKDWPQYHVIDHHSRTTNWNSKAYIDDSKGACSEIALQMAMMTGAKLTDEMAIAGLAGIIADTGKYRYARPVDLEVSSFLLGGSNITMEDVLDIIEGEEFFDVSKKIAQIKAMKRIRYRRIDDQIVASSKVRSFEASACRALLVCGADVAFVASDNKNTIRISARAKPHILKMGVHLGEFMDGIAKKTDNQGGGHDGAAGLNGKGDANKILSLCVNDISHILQAKIDPEKGSVKDPSVKGDMKS